MSRPKKDSCEFTRNLSVVLDEALKEVQALQHFCLRKKKVHGSVFSLFFSLQTTVTVFSSARIQTMSVSSLHKLSGTLQLTWFSDSCIFLSISKKNSTTSLTGTQFTFFSSSSSVVVGFGTCCSQRQNDLLWVLLFLSLSVSDCLNVYATYDNIKQQQLKKKKK